jgi:hypothetical protein
LLFVELLARKMRADKRVYFLLSTERKRGRACCFGREPNEFLCCFCYKRREEKALEVLLLPTIFLLKAVGEREV